MYAALVLLNHNLPHEALRFLQAIAHSRWDDHSSTLTPVGYSIYLKTYIALRHLDGIRSIVEQHLTSGVIVDVKFARILKEAKSRAVDVRKASSSGRISALENLLEDLYERVKIHRLQFRVNSRIQAGNLIRLMRTALPTKEKRKARRLDVKPTGKTRKKSYHPAIRPEDVVTRAYWRDVNAQRTEMLAGCNGRKGGE
jgi:hypothetical protein